MSPSEQVGISIGCAIGPYFDEMYYSSDVEEVLPASRYVPLSNFKRLERNQSYFCLALIILHGLSCVQSIGSSYECYTLKLHIA